MTLFYSQPYKRGNVTMDAAKVTDTFVAVSTVPSSTAVSFASTRRTSNAKAHHCGSLFANCNCSGKPNRKDSSSDRSSSRKKLFQSYSHPDTGQIFNSIDDTEQSDATKLSTSTPTSKPIRVHRHSLAKRLSTPNIGGNYSVLDVAVHPEVVLTVSHANGQIEPRYATHGAAAVHRKSKSVLKNVKLQNLRTNLTKSLEVLQKSGGNSSGGGGGDGGGSGGGSVGNYYINSSNESISSTNNSQEDIFYPASHSFDGVDDNGNNSNNNNNNNNRNELNTDQPADNLVYLKYNALGYQHHQDPVQQQHARAELEHKKSLDDRKKKNSQNNLRHSFGEQRQTGDLNFYQAPRYWKHSDQTMLILEDELWKLKDVIKERDCEISKLKREIHKLKSVLQQTTVQMENGIDSNVPNCTIYDANANKQLIQMNGNQLIPVPLNTAKRQGVSGESSDATGQLSRDITIRKYDKDFSSKQLIKSAIMDNDFLKNLDSSQVREVIDSMYGRDVINGEYVIREGDAGAHLYVSADGLFEVIKDGKQLGQMGPGKAFGELAILYNCTRTASIRVLCDSKVWVLDRRAFQQIMMRTGMQRIEENVNFLKSVPLLRNLSNNILAKVADALEVEFFPAGTYVIRQGASGDTFYLISQGTVKVTQRMPGCQLNEDEIRTLTRGDYFGEQALIKEDKRTANIIAMPPGVECLTLDRESFTQLIGDLCELHEKDYGDQVRVLAMKKSESSGLIFRSDTKQELLDIDFKDLDVVTTLGVGGFGRVELVKYVNGKSTTQIYALKCLKKHHIVDTHQEEHVFSERSIMLACSSPFICRLYRTYRDDKYVYMLLEACMGGEVWTILRNRGYFDESTTQFIIGCVLQAFDYLHARGIVYRDLKPENLMLDVRGYIKLVDFGFSKYIGYSSKTWTFCGTPEYVAPEVILNKGHDRAVDYWALGILIYELLTGSPPFTSTDPMKTYNIILKGIDMIDFPKHLSRSAIILIKRLCRDLPCERLGYQRGGIQLIKKHKWFQGFDWDGLASLSLIAPINPRLNGPLDTSNFDYFPKEDEDDDVKTEFSGWDKDF